MAKSPGLAALSTGAPELGRKAASQTLAAVGAPPTLGTDCPCLESCLKAVVGRSGPQGVCQALYRSPQLPLQYPAVSQAPSWWGVTEECGCHPHGWFSHTHAHTHAPHYRNSSEHHTWPSTGGSTLRCAQLTRRYSKAEEMAVSRLLLQISHTVSRWPLVLTRGQLWQFLQRAGSDSHVHTKWFRPSSPSRCLWDVAGSRIGPSGGCGLWGGRQGSAGQPRLPGRRPHSGHALLLQVGLHVAHSHALAGPFPSVPRCLRAGEQIGRAALLRPQGGHLGESRAGLKAEPMVGWPGSCWL